MYHYPCSSLSARSGIHGCLRRNGAVCFIIIDAVNDLVSWYKSFGFEPIRQMAVENAGFTTRMYYDCYHHDRAELERYERPVSMILYKNETKEGSLCVM